jgi:crossover junction endodeoxyribonuclease RuvC
MNKVIIGIDPGLNGAIAVITPEAYAVHDIPVLEVKKGKSVKRRYNAVEIARIIKTVLTNAAVKNQNVEVWLEDVHAMPGQGVTSMFSMGRGLGIYEGIVSAIGLPLQYISPITWKKKVMNGQGKEKDAAVYKAQQLFPNAVLTTPRGRLLDGRAEALLIAYYGMKYSF